MSSDSSGGTRAREVEQTSGRESDESEDGEERERGKRSAGGVGAMTGAVCVPRVWTMVLCL